MAAAAAGVASIFACEQNRDKYGVMGKVSFDIIAYPYILKKVF